MGGTMQYKLDSFLRAQKSYKENTPIQAYMRECLLKMLIKISKSLDFPYIFEFGCGQCELTNMLANNISYKSYICNDINIETQVLEAPRCFSSQDFLVTPEHFQDPWPWGFL